MPYDPERKRRYNRTHYLKTKKKRELATGATEKKVLWQGRLPETLVARIQRVTLEGIATGRYPWKTSTECVVDLVRRGFGTMKGDPIIDEFLPAIELDQHLDRVNSLRRQSQSTLSKARQEISELLQIGARDGAASYYHMTMEAAQKMPPTEWRDWLLIELRKSFPDLAKQKVKAVALFKKASAHKSSKSHNSRRVSLRGR